MGFRTEKKLGLSRAEQDQQLIWHPFTPLIGSEDNLVITKASEARLYTDDGRVIIDAIASWWVNLHGHSHPDMMQAIATQASQLEHVMFAGFTHAPAIDLAENLLSILPDNQSKIFYSDNGSTAVEVGLKMALQYWHNQEIPRKKVIAFEGAYHGDTFGGMSLGDRGAFTRPFWPFLFEVVFVPIPALGNEQAVLKQIESLLKSSEVAAFIFEPIIQGAAGMRTYSAEALDSIIEMVQNDGVVCIADEVMTGFGRTGNMFASDLLTHKPDIFCLSKGLTGGAMAMGATSCTDKIQSVYKKQDLLKTFFHGHSFTANPIACAAANASFKLLITPECQANIERVTDRHAAFRTKICDHPGVQNVTHLGTILSLELRSEEETSYVNEARHKLYPYFISRGVLLRPLGNIIYILPPYVITDDELDQVYQAIEDLLDRPTLLA